MIDIFDYYLNFIYFLDFLHTIKFGINIMFVKIYNSINSKIINYGL